MKPIYNAVMIFVLVFLSGCASKQTISEFNEAPPKTVCIAKHEAVKSGILDALEEGFHTHGADTKVVRGIYEEKHNLWNPRIYPNELGGCNAIAFYVANWAWDISMYMHFANIWITDIAMTKKIAQATYQSGGGPNKWINARKKILELVDEMYVSEGQRQLGVNRNANAVKKKSTLMQKPPSSNNDPTLTLQKLKDMYEKGLINEHEYTSKKKQILDNM